MLDENDHRNLGKRLDLFHLQEEAPGMVFWHPRGFTLYRQLEDAVRRQMVGDGFREVRTPQILRQSIWEASGHWQSFAADMFVLTDEERAASAVKPVSCPGHLQIVERMAPSYRDLPIRIGELGLVHRNEASGTLHGLFRLRQFTQDDGHIFLEEGQIAGEVARFCASLRRFYAALGFAQVAIGFSTRPPVRAGSDAVWDHAENVLRAALEATGLDAVEQPGEGAFYGPKLEFVLHDRLGRPWQCGTIQLDFMLPERFGVRYVDASGTRRPPVMLHRATLGSLERFLGILLEHHDGALPPWLAPDQAIVAPVSEAHRPYAERVLTALRAAGVRAELDARGETLARRVVDSHALGVPILVVVGGRESERGAITLRERDGARREMPLEAGVTEVVRACRPPI
jgi:threonyl-tRNA synthetase